MGQIMAKKFSLEALITLTDGVTKPMAQMEKSVSKFGRTMKKNFGAVGNDFKALDSGINKAAKGLAVGAVAIGAGVLVLGNSFIQAGKDVEGYKTVLKTMLGTQELANARFEEYSKFAAVTPFELNDVVELGNKLQSLGAYSKQNMTDLGDLAAATKKPIDQVANAFAKLVSGQKGEAVNMFRDLNISTKDWMAATGKGISKSGELMATTEEMLAALPIIMGKKGFSGMMANASKDAAGMESNFNDTITRFKQSVGGILLPAYKKLLGVLTGIAEKFSVAFNKNAEKYVSLIAKGIENLANWLVKLDVEKLVKDIIEWGKSIKNMIDLVVTLTPLIITLVITIKAITLAMTIYSGVMLLVTATSWPVTLIILAVAAAIGLLVVIVIQMVKHWDTIIQAMKNAGSFIMTFGQIILKWLLSPVNLVVEAISALLGVLSNLPGVGNVFKGAQAGLDKFQNTVNKTLTGSEGIFDYQATITNAEDKRAAMNATYANPSTKGAESRNFVESKTTNEVILRAEKGTSMSPLGGAPSQFLMYGVAQ